MSLPEPTRSLASLVLCGPCDTPMSSVHLAPSGDAVLSCSRCGTRVREQTLLDLWAAQLRELRLELPHVGQAVQSVPARRGGGEILVQMRAAGDTFPLASLADQRLLVHLLTARLSWNGHSLIVSWRPPVHLLAARSDSGPAPAVVLDLLGAFVECNQATTSQTLAVLDRIATAVERIAPPPTWLTREQAAQHLQISLDTLKRIVKENGHLDGGPVDFGHGRKMLRFHSATIDDWYLEAGRPAMVEPLKARRRRPRRRKPAEAATQTPVDWSKV